MKYFLLFFLSFSGCITNQPSKNSHDVLPLKCEIVWNHSIKEVESSSYWKVTKTRYATGLAIYPEFEGQKIHYTVDTIEGQKHEKYFLYYSFIDEEDGGNAYGWVEDRYGKRVGKIFDYILYKEK